MVKWEYSDEPDNKKQYTEQFDREYSRYAGLYDKAVKILPLWKTWLRKTLPYIKGNRVLELSFGTGYLLTRYAGNFSTYGLDYNRDMVKLASRNLEKKKLKAELVQGDVENMPYSDNTFDCIVNTMAFTGYPDGDKAMAEINRVLKPGGQLVLLDFNYPAGGNPVGVFITNMMKKAGDIIRDMNSLFQRHGFTYSDMEIGGFGSVHLYVAKKKDTVT